MKSISYSGDLKKDIDSTRKNFNFWSSNKKNFIRSGTVSLLTGVCFGLVSLNPIIGSLMFLSTLCSGLGISLIKSDKKHTNMIKEREKAIRRMDNFTTKSESDLNISTYNLENAEISKDYIIYKNKNGKVKKEEIRNYYIKNKNGEMIMLTEMRNELALLLHDKRVNASLEITDGCSIMETDYSYGLYLMDGSEYSDVRTKKTLTLTVR